MLVTRKTKRRRRRVLIENAPNLNLDTFCKQDFEITQCLVVDLFLALIDNMRSADEVALR